MDHSYIDLSLNINSGNTKINLAAMLTDGCCDNRSQARWHIKIGSPHYCKILFGYVNHVSFNITNY